MAAAGGAVAVVVIALSLLGGSPPTVLPGPSDHGSGATASRPAAVGPVVFYEVLDADGSSLMERRLDGQSLPRRVAQRTDVDYGRTWTVDPAGTIAIAAIPAGPQERLAAVAVADGSDLWSADLPFAPLDEAVWSADGQRLAVITRPEDVGATESFVIDTRDGRITRTVIPENGVLQGFDADDALIIRLRQAEAAGSGWRFFRIDPASNVVVQLATLPDVGPSTTGTDDVDPARGVGASVGIGPNDRGSAVQAWTASGGPARSLGVFPSVDRIAIDPEGSGVAFSANQALRFLSWDGRADDVWSGEDPIRDFGWSADGDYVWIATDRRGPNLTLIERSSGRTIALPGADRVAQSLMVRVIGGVPLPEAALPAVEPTPLPTPGPSGPDLVGGPNLASAWFDTSTGTIVLHLDRLAATSEGGMRVVASMTPLGFGPVPNPDDTGRDVVLLPRPGTSEVLVWVSTPDRGRGWLWDGSAAPPTSIDLPGDWPANAYDVAWRPDGKALAASAGRIGLDGDIEAVFVVARLGASRTTVIPERHEYDRLEGWWSSTELRVGHAICTEGCPGRYAFSARLRIRDGHLTQLTPADRSRAPIDETYPDGHGGIVMSMTNDDPADDIRIDWPITGGSPGGPQVVRIGPRSRSLILADTASDGTDVYRVDDPIGRAVNGRLADPRPVRIAHLSRHGLDVRVSDDERWAITVDRVGAIQLVELATGRGWSVDPDRTVTWWPAE